MLLESDRRPVPQRALVISLAALAIPVAAAFWFPGWTGTGSGVLIWLTALIPAFLLAYYRGLAGAAIALAGGMAVLTATQVAIIALEVGDPDWAELAAVVIVYLTVVAGIAGLAEVLRRERHAAEEMALIDRLTGLPNRRHADIVLEREFAAAERGRKLTVVIFDLDRFKDVNDKHGHGTGDETLRQFAQVLLANTRKENLSARFGGEEFLSILRDSDADGAVVFAQRVLNQTRTKSFASGTQTASAGIATYEEGMGSHELLLSAADRALYLAKDGGRDMVCVAQQVAPVGPVKRRPGAPPPPKPPEPAAPKPPGAKIYVVDDDTAVRSVMKRVLVGAGHDVWDTSDPREAIRQFAASSPAKRPDVILTDVIMPEMTGMTMIDRIAQIAPDVRVIYMSGYVQSKISYAGTPGNVVTFLEKPVNFEGLLAAVASVKPMPKPDMTAT